MVMEPLITTADDVYRPFDAMLSVAERMVMDQKLSIPHAASAAQMISGGFIQLQKWTQKQGVNLKLDWTRGFIEQGALTSIVLGRINRVEFAKLLLSKHQAYGAAPLMKWGPLGVLIRMDSKWERYVNLSSRTPEQIADDKMTMEESSVQESITDTLHDILGYCVLGFHVAARIKQQELQKELLQ